MQYTVIVELDTKDVAAVVDPLMDAMDGYAPSVSTTTTGHAQVRITMTADTVRQAVTAALAMATTADVGDVLGVHALPTTEQDLRDRAEIPPLLNVTQVADHLGITPQAVRLRLAAGTLPGVLVGGTVWVVPVAAVH